MNFGKNGSKLILHLLLTNIITTYTMPCEQMLFTWALQICYFSKLKQFHVMITKCVRIIQICPSLLHFQETIVKKFHHRPPHQNHKKKNRDRNRMYVSSFLYY